MMRREFGGVYIANEGFSAESAGEAVANGTADAVAFGKAAIANADLVERIRVGADWSVPDAETFYGGGAKGYVDYPKVGKSEGLKV
jgi:2,4-dienoyl-CoA reductase-like NADH-dependent reductase (Old Yellow Enzyme family)